MTASRTTLRLPNGLLWHLLPHAGHAVALGVVVSVGSWHDPPGQAGLSFLLRRMLFHGSRSLDARRMRDELAFRAARLNSNSLPERTIFSIALPASELEFALSFLRNFVFEPVLPPQLLPIEQRQIALEAVGRRQGLTWPSRWDEWLSHISVGPQDLSRVLRLAVLRGSRLGRSVAGSRQTLRAIRPNDLRQFHERHYRPERTVIVAIGDLEPERLQRLLELYFGDMRVSPEPLPLTAPALSARPARGPRHIVRNDEKAMRWQWTGFGASTGPLSMAQLPALFLARDLIHDEIELRLKSVAGRNIHTESRVTFFQNNTVWTFGLRTYWRQTASAERALPAILDDLAQGRFGAARLERLRQTAQHNWLMFGENAEALLWWLCELPAIFVEPPEAPTEALLTAPVEDVRDMVGRLLGSPERIVYLHQPIWVWLPAVVLATLGLIVAGTYLLGIFFRILGLVLGLS